MTGNIGRPGPDLRLLADLDAGLLDEATARAVRAAAEADPAARAVLDALTATRAELAALPDPPVPPAVAARWSAALAAEQAPRPAAPDTATAAAPPTSHPMGVLRTPPAPCEENEGVQSPTSPAAGPSAGAAAPHPAAAARPPATTPQPAAPPAERHPGDAPRVGNDPRGRRADRDGSNDPRGRRADRGPSAEDRGPGRRHPPRTAGFPRRARGAGRLLRRPAVLAAVLLVAVAGVAGLRAHSDPPAVGRPQLVAEALSAVGVRDAAGLDDLLRRAGCLHAVGATVDGPDAPLLGGRRVTFEGRPGVLLVLGTGQRGAFDVLIVDTDCGPGGGTLLAATRVTPR